MKAGRHIHDALDLVGKKRTLGLVTPRESGGGSSSDADVVRSEARKHSNRIELLDWVDYSAGHPSWFQPDGLHLTFPGAEAFADLLRKPLKDLPKPH
jgi:lysophospholipase L1-like esterase